MTKLAIAQSSSTTMGGRAQGIGNATSAVSDGWSLWSNPSGLAKQEQSETDFSLHRSPLPGANRIAATVSHPFSLGCVALGIFRFGDAIYNEQLLAVGYGHSYGITSLGLRFNVIQYQASSYQTHTNWGLTFGGITSLTRQLAIGAYVSNLNQPKLASGELLPVKLCTGVRFQPNQNFFLAMEIEKDLSYEALFKVGMEYFLNKKFAVRTGFNLNPNAAFAGWGFISSILRVDFALQANRLTGLSQQLSVGCYFRRKPASKS